jgi:hypothetical protein
MAPFPFRKIYIAIEISGGPAERVFPHSSLPLAFLVFDDKERRIRRSSSSRQRSAKAEVTPRRGRHAELSTASSAPLMMVMEEGQVVVCFFRRPVLLPRTFLCHALPLASFFSRSCTIAGAAALPPRFIMNKQKPDRKEN